MALINLYNYKIVIFSMSILQKENKLWFNDKELANILTKIKEGDIVDAQVKSILDWGALTTDVTANMPMPDQSIIYGNS